MVPLKETKIIDHKGKIIIDQCIANYFNQYFVEIGLKTDKKISLTSKNYRDYLKDIYCNNTFFLRAVRTHEIQEIILTFDSNKSTGPSSIPIYILKAFNNFFSSILCKIINLVFETGIFPDLCKLAKVIPIYKRMMHYCVKTTDPFHCCLYLVKFLRNLYMEECTNFCMSKI